jgi:hypothetical protein
MALEENTKKFKLVFYPNQQYRQIPDDFDGKTREIVTVSSF